MRLIYSFGLTSLLVSLWVVQTCSATLPNGAQNLEDSAKPAGNNRLFNRAIRGSHGNAPAPRLGGQAKSQPTPQKTTPSPPPPPVETGNEPESGEDRPEGTEVEGNFAEEAVSSTTTSTTEAPRRRTVLPVKRIQSNKDFMEKLKRRREEQHQPGFTLVPHTTTSTTEKPIKQNTPGNKKNNPPKTPTAPTNQGSRKNPTPTRRYNAKAVTPAQTTPLPVSSNEAIAEESNLATQSSKIRTYPKARRTSAS
ncbi:myb-like protein V [Planococcus citri]|uniref:myb-like protein V n=1 Tax=Planococcus citri TaxID=170843 RepID=UPI0031F77EB2